MLFTSKKMIIKKPEKETTQNWCNAQYILTLLFITYSNKNKYFLDLWNPNI